MFCSSCPLGPSKRIGNRCVWRCFDVPRSPRWGCAGDMVKLEGHAGRHRQESCFLKQVCVYREIQYPTFPECLSLTFVPVCLYWCCNRGFSPQRITCGVHCSFMKWYRNIFKFSVFFPFCDSISVCGCLTMHPNGFDLVTACLTVGRGTGN